MGLDKQLAPLGLIIMAIINFLQIGRPDGTESAP